jgi:membrane-associated phospholipid phosphatase
MRNLLIFLCLSITGAAGAAERLSNPQWVKRWNELALQSIRDKKIPPPLATQYLAAMHVGMFEISNLYDERYESLLHPPELGSHKTHLWQRLHIGYLALEILNLFASQESLLGARQLMADELAHSGNTENTTHSALQENARELAEYIKFVYLQNPTDRQDHQGNPDAGHWQRTAPDYKPFLLPGWGLQKTWWISPAELASVRPVAPPALHSEEYAEALLEVSRLGEKSSRERTAEQTEIALFWADGAGTATPPGHWNLILSHLTCDCDEFENLTDMTRNFALLNTAMADAGIAAWESKWFFDFWRPITAIQRANEDHNGKTVDDQSWVPLLPTPPFPAYVSGHATFSAAAAMIMESIFGVPTSPLGIHSEALPGVTRRFGNFHAMAEESARSRIYGGIHYSFDGTAGLELGQKIARLHLKRAFKARP